MGRHFKVKTDHDSLKCFFDPDLNRNAIDYRDNHKYRDAITIKTEMQHK